jgi:hypothetical protein
MQVEESRKRCGNREGVNKMGGNVDDEGKSESLAERGKN